MYAKPKEADMVGYVLYVQHGMKIEKGITTIDPSIYPRGLRPPPHGENKHDCRPMLTQRTHAPAIATTPSQMIAVRNEPQAPTLLAVTGPRNELKASLLPW
jgi:hypothetical protein